MGFTFLKQARLSVYLLILQVIFIILFAIFVEYDSLGLPEKEDGHGAVGKHGNHNDSVEHGETAETHGETAKKTILQSYAMFQDIHVMIFVGFGFLMTFLKRYGFGSLAFNMLISAFVIQWATLTSGWILHFEHGAIHVDMLTLIGAEFAAAAVLISFGAVLGKLNPLQLITMALSEIVFFQLNELIVFNIFKATDIGDSMVVHVFGAYFGLGVALLTGRQADTEAAEHKEASVYHSDLFAMIGTIFLWLFWPSFNSATAADEGQYRAIVNTYYSLTASTLVAFAVSALVHKGKFNMVHIQNATLAGGVAVGTMADMIIQPWGAIVIGSVAGLLSVLGYKYITPFLTHKLRIHDTCGVNNLHGMPGIMSGFGGAICAALATKSGYGDNLFKLFPAMEEGRTSSQQALYQLAALTVSFAMAAGGGALTGLLLRLPIWSQPTGGQIFDDTDYWVVPDDGFPAVEEIPKNKKVEETAMLEKV